jgi:hypothetical protein
MSTLIQATEAHVPAACDSFWKYLQWANANLQHPYEAQFDIAAMLAHDMQAIDIFCPFWPAAAGAR